MHMKEIRALRRMKIEPKAKRNKLDKAILNMSQEEIEALRRIVHGSMGL
jgi:hypothetical protein